MRPPEFIKGVGAFIMPMELSVGIINATLFSLLCDLRDLSGAGVQLFPIWKKFVMRSMERCRILQTCIMAGRDVTNL